MRFLLLSLICFFSVFAASADNDKEKRIQMFKEIQEFKMKYLAKEMGLDDAQKQKFFELYDEMTAKKQECMKNARKLERQLKKLEKPTEADYQAATQAMTKARAEDAAIEKAYAEKFSTFLTQKQIFKMKEGEESFRKKLEEMRQKNHHKDKKEKKEKK